MKAFLNVDAIIQRVFLMAGQVQVIMEELLRASEVPIQEVFGKKIAMLKVNMILF